jgi:poly-beta-1,6-N-acetyl-D-glucosamine synthase
MSQSTQRNHVKYVIVSPVRDEAEYIEKTIRSVIAQTIPPAEWIIVNDGSHDNTADVVNEFASKYPWIKAVHRADRGSRVPGTGVVEAFYDGYGLLQSQDWHFLVKLDGDVGLETDYFQRCFEKFDQDQRLGMCSGVMYVPDKNGLRVESCPAFHVRGPIKLYRRACWEAIGGLIKAPGWDTVDEVQANRLGWRTQSFPDMKVMHYRPTGAVQGNWCNGVKLGRAAFISGYHPLFMLARCVKRTLRNPAAAIANGYGFLTGYTKGLARVNDQELVRYLRSQQLRRLLWLESIWK